jgi:hypothetical protein
MMITSLMILGLIQLTVMAAIMMATHLGITLRQRKGKRMMKLSGSLRVGRRRKRTIDLVLILVL